jgi:hypothetical protein
MNTAAGLPPLGGENIGLHCLIDSQKRIHTAGNSDFLG